MPERPPDLLGMDDFHIYLWKPAGRPVFPPHGDPAGDCLLARWLPLAAPGPWPPGFEGGLAHRLDNATSGVVVAARTPEALAALREALRAGLVRKFYLFRAGPADGSLRPSGERLAAGEAGFRERLVTTPIAHHPRRADRMVVCRTADPERTPHRGRWYPAWTLFSRFGALWQAEIRTGVMHQIRVHAASVGLPLTGDTLYGGPPGPFLLHHRRIVGPGWASPEAPVPEAPEAEPAS